MGYVWDWNWVWWEVEAENGMFDSGFGITERR